MSALTASEAGATYRVVRSKRRHRCGGQRDDSCTQVVEPGERYVRAVMFPNHDVYAYVDRKTGRPLRRPIVTPLCFVCAAQYAVTDELVRAATV